MAETNTYTKEMCEKLILNDGRYDGKLPFSTVMRILAEKLLKTLICLEQATALETIHTDQIEAMAGQIERLKTTENLYAAATKALNSQLEINNKLKAEIEQQQKCIEKLKTICKVTYDYLCSSSKLDWDNVITPKLEEAITQAEELTKGE